MWNTLSAGLQMVQEKLDNVLDDPENQDEHDGDPSLPVNSESRDSPVTVTTEPPSPSKTEASLGGSNGSETERLLFRVSTIQQALEESEKQTQLINSEYKKLLAKKENDIKMLKDKLNPTCDDQTTPITGTDHTPSHEILMKELAAHKEMVAELRGQLEEKETEFQELNSKAETKFTKLRAQAKNKIANLNREMERLKQERGENESFQTSLNVSSLDDSLSPESLSPSISTEHAQLESLKSELSEKESELTSLRMELSQRKTEGEKLRTEMASLKDKLNVSEVCLQKEQDCRVAMELRLTELEENLDQVTSDLCLVQKEKQTLQESMKKEEEAENPVEETSSNNTQSPSKTLQTGEDHSISVSPSVLAAGERGSLIDMESEISQLEGIIRERDEQLSSFKSVLEEKDSRLKKQQEKEIELNSQIQELHSQRESRISEMERSQTELSASVQTAQEAQEIINCLESKISEFESKEEEQGTSLSVKSSQITQLTNTIEEAKGIREKLELELISKVDAIENLSDSLSSLKRLIKEKEEIISAKTSEIEELGLSVQRAEVSNESLKLNVDSSMQETNEKLVSYSNKIQELEGELSELRNKLERKELDVAEASSTNRLLEEKLMVAQETLVQKESAQEEMEKSLTTQREGNGQEIEKLQKELEMEHSQLQVAISERDGARDELSQAQLSLARSQDTLKQLNNEKETILAQSTDVQLQVSKISGALEFAQGELTSRDSTIKSLSGALEESKAALAKAENKLSQQKSELTDKITEAMQRSEKSMESKSVLENELRSARQDLQRIDTELRQTQTQLDEVLKDKSCIQTELDIAVSKLNNLEREREQSKVESETLRGQVDSLSETKSTFSLEQTKHKETLAELNSKLAESAAQIQDLQKKLQLAKKKLSRAIAVKDEELSRRVEVEADLSRHERENQQMKEQFESAVKMMESKLSEQGATLTRINKEIEQKDSLITSVKEQLALESQNNSELKDKVVRMTADHKVAMDRCHLLENEKTQLKQSLLDLTSKHNHLEHIYSESLSEKEELQLEHRASLKGVQEHESRVMSLSDQLAQVAREKQALEGQLHDVTKQLLSSEQGKLQISSELERHREIIRDVKNWEREKQDLLNEKTALVKKESQLQASETNAVSRISVLETSLAQLQEELEKSHAELDANKNSIKDVPENDDHQKKISELQQSHGSEILHLQHVHSTELTSLQRSLQEEKDKREAAERSLLAQGDVSIAMEDVQPFASVGNGMESPSTLVDYVNIASLWIQRLVKNPNIVLTRFLRATPQTKLFFLAYFSFLHLLIVYILIL